VNRARSHSCRGCNAVLDPQSVGHVDCDADGGTVSQVTRRAARAQARSKGAAIVLPKQAAQRSGNSRDPDAQHVESRIERRGIDKPVNAVRTGWTNLFTSADHGASQSGETRCAASLRDRAVKRSAPVAMSIWLVTIDAAAHRDRAATACRRIELVGAAITITHGAFAIRVLTRGATVANVSSDARRTPIRHELRCPSAHR
jgi:hypothetical protein